MEKYNQEWFTKRAFKSLKRLSGDTWDYTDSLLLYTSSGSGEYESLQETDTPYFALVTRPEHEYLSVISKNIADLLPNNFEYVDLGPGTEHKEQFIFDELKKQGKTFTYIPVDISDHFLDLAGLHAENQDIHTKKIKASFEELPGLLGNDTKPRFVSLGLTFSNYLPQEILELLVKIAGKNGYIFINSQMRDRVDMPTLQAVYQNDAAHLADEKLRIIGLDPIKDITPSVADDGFRVSCVVLKTNKKLEDIGVKDGDTLILFQSLRYTKDSLDKELQKFDHTLFDTGSSFIGAIIRT